MSNDPASLLEEAIQQREYESSIVRQPFQQALQRAEQYRLQPRFPWNRPLSSTPKAVKQIPSISELCERYQQHQSVLVYSSPVPTIRQEEVLRVLQSSGHSIKEMDRRRQIAVVLLRFFLKQYKVGQDIELLFVPSIRPYLEPFQRVRSSYEGEWYHCGYRNQVESCWLAVCSSSDRSSLSSTLHSWIIGSYLRSCRQWTSCFLYPFEGCCILDESHPVLCIFWESMPSLSLRQAFPRLTILEWKSILTLLLYGLATAYQTMQFRHGHLTLDAIHLRSIPKKKYRWETCSFVSSYEPMIVRFDRSRLISPDGRSVDPIEDKVVNNESDIECLYRSLEEVYPLSAEHQELRQKLRLDWEEHLTPQSLYHLLIQEM